MDLAHAVRFAVAAFALSSPAPAQDGTEPGNLLFEVAVDRSFLDELAQLPFRETRAIQEYVRGILMRGTALTEGQARLGSYEDRYSLGLEVVLDSKTTATTINLAQPRYDVGLRIDWRIDTASRTAKRLLVSEHGISIDRAATNADSTITILNVETYADGLFPRLKRRMAEALAWRELMATKERNEAEAAARIAGELNATLDDRVADLLVEAQAAYRRYVFDPLIGRGFLGGRLRMMSLREALVVAGVRDLAEPVPFDAWRLVSPARPIVLRIAPGAVENLAAARFGGAQLSDVDVAEIVLREDTRQETVEDVIGSPEEVLMTYDLLRPRQGVRDGG